MGNIYRKVEICGINAEGDKLGCARGIALVDTGATASIVSSAFAKRAKAINLRMDRPSTVDQRPVKSSLMAITLDAPGCRIRPSVVVVDDELISRAGEDDEGNQIEVILGHDYLQGERATIRYDESPAQVSCAVVQAKKPIKRRRKR